MHKCFKCSATLILIVLLQIIVSCHQKPSFGQLQASKHDLVFQNLAETWDEAIPLGNGAVGALIWQKDNKLRFSLDRADLWDLRPVKEFSGDKYRLSWVYDQVMKGDYKPVQEMSDLPYERDPGPTKIPAGALEFDLSPFGEIESVQLYLNSAICQVIWKNGTRLRTFVHATKPIGWYIFDFLPSQLTPQIIPPPYGKIEVTPGAKATSVSGHDLRRLGYEKGQLSSKASKANYFQMGWGGFSYDISVEWYQPDETSLAGVWSVTSQNDTQAHKAQDEVAEALKRGYSEDFQSHHLWWQDYWQQSSIQLPDSLLEIQWYREMYKQGSASRKGAPPISLQAVWTADNGRIPPWKGDFHHDLNTQLSYWPCYSSNHLEEGLVFLDWLDKIRPAAQKYTKDFFNSDGLNVPGVSTLTGEPMGGWMQYSFSPTVSAWLAQHFYLHWRYSMDRTFLKEKAYPWIKDVANYLDDVSVRDRHGKRKLPLSSSPEINDNRITAWFTETTNYDLALIRWLYEVAAELAEELELTTEAGKWHTILSEWPELAKSDEDGRLLVAPKVPLHESHRHFSHLMAIHPLGIIDWENGLQDRQTIQAALSELERLGTKYWVGYSFSWLGNIAARARDGERAAEALSTFSRAFCLPNSFHVNGDQTKSGFSNFTYRPFTLEGNFAFASGIQEMLIQSHTGVIRIFPAVPDSWKNIRFEKLRAEGAFLISADKTDGEVSRVAITSEKGGLLKLANPFGANKFDISGVDISDDLLSNDIISIRTKPGSNIILQKR